MANNNSVDLDKLDSHIEQLRKGNTLTENEVKALCEKVRSVMHNGSSRSSSSSSGAWGSRHNQHARTHASKQATVATGRGRSRLVTLASGAVSAARRRARKGRLITAVHNMATHIIYGDTIMATEQIEVSVATLLICPTAAATFVLRCRKKRKQNRCALGSLSLSVCLSLSHTRQHLLPSFFCHLPAHILICRRKRSCVTSRTCSR